MKRVTVLHAVCMLLLAGSIQAQGPQGPPKPGPEVNRLAYFLGTWKVEGETKAFGSMPGGKFTATEQCDWFSGGFFLMCHEDATGPMGSETSVFFLGYDPKEKVYTYHQFSSIGEANESKGTVNGDTWNWTAESKMGDARISMRFTIKEVSQTEDRVKLEMSQNGGAFSVVEEATGRKLTR